MLASIDPSALKEHRRYLYRYAMQQVRDAEAADDLVQDTLLAALESGGRFQGRSAFRTWLVGVLKHKIADSFRYRARAPVSLDALGDADWRDEGGTEVVERLIGAAPAAQSRKPKPRRRFWKACQARLDRMPVQAAQAFVMSDVLGHDSDPVCRSLGITAANLWTTLHRARRRLQTELAPLRPASLRRPAPAPPAQKGDQVIGLVLRLRVLPTIRTGTQPRDAAARRRSAGS
jgi:RNA polymerase sigma-70 factor (ECF subfamily)